MYLWRLVGPAPSEGTLRSGVGADLAPILRLIEGHLTSADGLVGHVCEVVPRLSVLSLDAVHVATGREWLTFRDGNGGIMTAYVRPEMSPAERRALCAAYPVIMITFCAAAG